MRRVLLLVLAFIFSINFIYSVNVTVDWNHSIDGNNDWDWSNFLALDSSGNSYVTGYLYDGDADLYVISYDLNGNHRWNDSVDYNNGWDEARSLAIDSSSNIYAAGEVNNGVSTDLYVISYDLNGNHRWNDSVDYNNGTDKANSIDVDGSGNIYVVGTVNNGVNNDLYIISYDLNGNHRWNDSVDYNNGHDMAKSIVIDSSSNSYVIGNVNNGINQDIYIISYNGSGVHRWNKTIDSSGNDDTYSIDIDSSGNSYIAGYITNGNLDTYIISYDSNGVHRWNNTRSYGLSDNGYDIEVDTLGNSYVLGHRTLVTNDFYVAKYDSNGAYIWNNTVDYGGLDVAYSIDIDSSGNSYITGHIYDGLDLEMYVISYDSNGVHRWNYTFENNGVDDYSTYLVNDGNGNSYITGTFNNGLDEDMFVAKISEVQESTPSSTAPVSIFPVYGFTSILISISLFFIHFIYN